MSKLLAVSLAVVTLLATTTRTVEAQTTPEPRTAEAQTTPKQVPAWQFLVTSGTLVPTGTQRDAIKRANLTAAQVSYLVRPGLALSTTVGWARSRDLASGGGAKLDVFTYDFGAEARMRTLTTGSRMNFSPFAGGGAGARSYNHRDLPINATHDVAAYVSAGGEIGIGRIRLRLEMRDYLTGFAPHGGGGASEARNDVVLMTGLRFSAR